VRRGALLAGALLCLCACRSGESESAWLAVAFASPDVTQAIEAKRGLERSWPQATIVSSGDCGNLKPGLYLVAAAILPGRQAARDAVAKLEAERGAYASHCAVEPASRLALGVPVVDPSILEVQPNAVNWSDADRVSEVVKLAGPGYLWIRRRYEPGKEDAREGRRESVLYFAQDPRQAETLEEDCTQPDHAEYGEWIAVSCAREVAADRLLHGITVFARSASEPVHSIRRCREPRFLSDRELACKSEEVDADGELRLTEKTVRFR
jgi:hypothetical protein